MVAGRHDLHQMNAIIEPPAKRAASPLHHSSMRLTRPSKSPSAPAPDPVPMDFGFGNLASDIWTKQSRFRL